MWFLLLIAVIVAIGILLSLVLAIPVDAAFDLDVGGKLKLRAKVIWLFGLVSFENRGRKAPVAKLPEHKKHQKKPAHKFGLAENWEQFKSMLEIIRTKGLMNEVKKLIIRLFRCFGVRELEGDFTAGLPDPADTGMLWGIFTAVTMPFDWHFMRGIHVHPSFDRGVFEGRLHGVVRVRPLYLVAPVILLMFSTPVLRAVWKLIVVRWKRRRLQRSARYQLAA